jgi:hypothetical protein
VSRVYKGMVSTRQEIVTPGGGGASCGLELGGPGPFLVYAFDYPGHIYRLAPGQYSSNLCSGSRLLANHGTPAPSGPPATGAVDRSDNSPSTANAPRAVADSSAAAPSEPLATGTSGRPADSPARASLAIGVGLLAAVVASGLAILRTRHRSRAD